MTEDSMHRTLREALARNSGPSAEDVAVSMLAGVRCQVLHDQIVGASCVNCLSWARTIGLPFWEPSLAAHTAAAERRAITTMLADLDTRVRAAQDEVQGADFGTVLVATVNAYSDGCRAAAHAAVEQIQCHCGEPVAYGFDGDPTHHRGMCQHCDAVRCDAYPGECAHAAAEQTGGA